MADALTSPGPAVEVDGPDEHGVATLLFRSHRPANTMSHAMVERLSTELTGLAERDDMRVLILRGAEGVFSGGADLGAMAGMDEPGYRRFIEAEFALFDLVEGLPFVTLAAIEGACLGNAAELALACDLRIAADDLRYGFPETRIGFQGPALRLSRHVGLGLAKRLLFGGDIMGAEEAAGLGLITWTVQAAELTPAARQHARDLAALPRVALQETKRNLAAAYPEAAEMTANEIRSSLRTFRTEDATEGRAAFLAKRPAVFRGR